jgi:hypothetical protein
VSGHKRHHQVPEFYLRRFASGGQVSVRRRDGVAFDADPVNVAVESGFYDVPDGRGGKSKRVEHLLADVEALAKGAMEAIDRSHRPPAPGSNEREVLALFIALQMTRTTQHREEALFPRRVFDWAAGRTLTHQLLAEYLEREHLGYKPREKEVEAALVVVTKFLEEPGDLTPEFAVEMMFTSVHDLVPRILALSWTVEIDPRREFLTSDMPVMLWRKPTNRDNYEGLGIDNSEEMRFPLDPGKQLVLSRRERPPTLQAAIHRVRRSNADRADACHRFIVGDPRDKAQLNAQYLDPWRPVIRFYIAPMYVTGRDGQARPEEGSDIVQVWIPRGASVGRPATATRPHRPE